MKQSRKAEANQRSTPVKAERSEEPTLSPNTSRLRCTESPRKIVQDLQSAFPYGSCAVFQFTNTGVVRISTDPPPSYAGIGGSLWNRFEHPSNISQSVSIPVAGRANSQFQVSCVHLVKRRAVSKA